MTQFDGAPSSRGLGRRAVVHAAAWTAPAIVVATAAPAFALSNTEEASSIGATTTSPKPNAVGRINPFGIDDLGDRGHFPAGQTFTLLSPDLDFDTIVLPGYPVGGTLTKVGPGEWLITPFEGVTDFDVRFRSATEGSYQLRSNGPVSAGTTWNGTVA